MNTATEAEAAAEVQWRAKLDAAQAQAEARVQVGGGEAALRKFGKIILSQAKQSCEHEKNATL